MAKTKISEFSTTAGNNTDINSINIAEGCAPSGINDAIRELMRQLKEFQTGGAGDSVNSGGDFSVATNKFTVASASGNTAVAGTLAVTGTTTLTGALVANGNATLGDGSGDTVTVKGTPTLEVNPTLSGGTANGVLYLNGSKVATSGSALTFDGGLLATGGKFGIIGNGANPTATALEIGTNGVGSRWLYNVPTGGEHNFTVNGVVASWVNATTSGWLISGSEAMRLTSTGLGIGTSSPASKLEVKTASPGYGFRIGDGTSVGVYDIGRQSDGLLYFYGNQSGFTGYVFSGVNGERMRLDSSGNLGLGVTPSAWWSGAKVVQLGQGSYVQGRTSDPSVVEVGANQFINGSVQRTYIASAPASYYEQNAGQHRWFNAPSGTAGDPITFTQALTLDANGKLLVGLTSSASTSADLQVNAPISLKGYTVAGLPTGTLGDIAYVTDALAPSFLATIVGGGAIKTPVFYNGTNWVAY